MFSWHKQLFMMPHSSHCESGQAKRRRLGVLSETPVVGVRSEGDQPVGNVPPEGSDPHLGSDLPPGESVVTSVFCQWHAIFTHCQYFPHCWYFWAPSGK